MSSLAGSLQVGHETAYQTANLLCFLIKSMKEILGYVALIERDIKVRFDFATGPLRG